MKQTFTLKLGQQLTMTPALQQAIRLLQLSSLDLHTEIQQVLESNPMLERDEEFVSDDSRELDREGRETSAEDVIPADLPVDADWEDIYIGSSSSSGAASNDDRAEAWEFRQASMHRRPSLREHLLWQAQLLDLGDLDASLVAHLIDEIDDDGYLQGWETLSQHLLEAYSTDPARLDGALATVQALDPAGVGARDLRECLLLQLDQLVPRNHGTALAQRIVGNHLDLLAERNPGALAGRLGLDAGDDGLALAMRLIRNLQPRPGASFSDQDEEYIVPEVLVVKRTNRWMVSLNPDLAPRIRINPRYLSLVRRADRSDDQVYLKQHLQEARYFLNSLRSRNETLLRVAQTIVERQRAFFEYGDEAMKPMVLRDVAEKLEVHESTVSRATSNKYMHTPRGLYELKYFFSSHVSTTGGGAVSATAIQAMIRRLVAQESPRKPHSDSKLTALLLDEGIKVARRTVAKYREGMRIPPSHERKRPG